jgi:type II secretory pathway component PulM
MSSATVSKRERFLLMLFPAALILAVYSVFFAVPLQRTFRQRSQEFNTAKLTAISESQAQLSREQLELTRSNLSRLKNTNQANQQKIAELGQSWRNLDNRLDTFQRVTEALHANDISIVLQSESTNPLVSVYIRNLVTIIDRQGPQELAFWEVEVEGSYTNMANFLSELSEQNMDIIPLAISMKSASGSSSLKNWKIVFLI